MIMDNFKPEKNKRNPFAYFTRVAWNAFLRRIAKENKETYTKHKNMQHQINVQDFLTELGVNKEGYNDGGINRSDDVIRNFEDKAAAAKIKKKRKAAAKKAAVTKSKKKRKKVKK
jgi:hypothetical protein